MDFDDCIDRVAAKLGKPRSVVSAVAEKLRDEWEHFHADEVILQETPSVLTFWAPSIYTAKDIAGFDFDDTLVVRGEKRLAYPTVPKVLRKIAGEGKCLVAFSNQKGITEEGVVDLTERLSFLFDQVGFRFSFIASRLEDGNRKPLPGMLTLAAEKSIYPLRTFHFVGDAAGRERKGKTKKDFSNSDAAFLFNASRLYPSVKCTFAVPEAIFGGVNDRPVPPLVFRYESLLRPTEEYDADIGQWKKVIREMTPCAVLLVGYPASGKSSLADALSEGKVPIATFDDGKPAAMRLIKGSITAGKTFLVANCNMTVEARAEVISLLPARYAVVILRLIDPDPEFGAAWHLNQLRKVAGGRGVPAIAYYTMRKRHVEPSEKEWDERRGVIGEIPMGFPSGAAPPHFGFIVEK